ncbi:hypothetical protein [Cohnella sp.]|uniref:hypothetical protein n=1 Tax=Cohnella sp. TaxID=1883426 RepID=UPI00370407A1
MEEYLIVSCNFRVPIDVIIAGQHVIGLVEQPDEKDRVLIAGQWYPIAAIMRSTPAEQIGEHYK